MKKIIVTALSIVVSIALIILAIIMISKKNTKPELYVYSFDKKEKLSFGYQEVYNMQEDEEEALISFECKDVNHILDVIRSSEYYITLDDGNKMLYYNGYYFKHYTYGNTIFLGNYVDIISAYHHIPAMNEYNIFFEIDYKRLEKSEYLKYNDYYCFEYSWNDLSRPTLFRINKKEKMIKYFESLNDRVAYYNKEEDCIYINAYQFMGFCLSDDRLTSDFPYIIKFSENGFYSGQKVPGGFKTPGI